MRLSSQPVDRTGLGGNTISCIADFLFSRLSVFSLDEVARDRSPKTIATFMKLEGNIAALPANTFKRTARFAYTLGQGG